MTIHKAQGQTITQNMAIHEWNKMKMLLGPFYKNMRYTAVTRAESLSKIGVCSLFDTVDGLASDDIPDTDVKAVMSAAKVRVREMEYRRSDPIQVQRENALSIINNIIRNPRVKDETVKKHTGLSSWDELMEYLSRDNPIPAGGKFEIHHIRPRCEFLTREELKGINHYSNLQLVTKWQHREITNEYGRQCKRQKIKNTL